MARNRDDTTTTYELGAGLQAREGPARQNVGRVSDPRTRVALSACTFDRKTRDAPLSGAPGVAKMPNAQPDLERHVRSVPRARKPPRLNPAELYPLPPADAP